MTREMTKEQMMVTELLDEIKSFDFGYIGCVNSYYITCKNRVNDGRFNLFGAIDRGLPIFKQSKKMFEKLLVQEPAYHQEINLILDKLTKVIEILDA